MYKLPEIIKEIHSRFGTRSHKITVVVGTGSSMSVDPDFGMGSLEIYLKDIIPNLIIDKPNLLKEWDQVLEKLGLGVDFENSLNGISSDGDLLNIIIKEAGNFVCRINQRFIPLLQAGEIQIPISVLFKELSKKFSMQDPTIDVITPNYDLLAEYAFIKAKVGFTDGFYGNIQKELNWREAESNFVRSDTIKGKKVCIKNYHFRLHKIHGSLNYFETGGKVIRDDTIALFETNTIDRFIITPGNTKYQRIIENFSEFYTECDKAIKNTDCFIFVGYGFNDGDIDSKIRKQLAKSGKNAIIITKKLLGKGRELISIYENIIAIEENHGEGGSIIHYQNETLAVSEDIWKIDTFVNKLLK